MKEITTNWYDDFSCIGGVCPYSCCRSEWKKDISDKEYEIYQTMQHPYRETIVKNILGEPGKWYLRMSEGQCVFLTPDGWCCIIQQCGYEYLPVVCQDFPRAIAHYGTVAEYDVEIACPYVAERLFENTPMEIRDGDDSKNEGTDIYNLLEPVRKHMLDMFLEGRTGCEYGKLYLLYTMVFKLRELSIRGELSAEAVRSLTELFRSKELIEGAYAQDQSIRSNRQRRIQAVRNSQVIQESIGFARSNEQVLSDDAAWKQLEKLCMDPEELGTLLMDWLPAFETSYPMFTTNYFVHALFQDWICADPQIFGERMITRAFAYTLTIMLIMAEEQAHGKLSIQQYAVIISWIERKIIHNRVVPDVVLNTMERSGMMDAVGIFTLLV